MFQKIFDRFGNDPFSFDTQAELYTLTQPVRKGGVINYRGFNYTCQSDTQAGSKVLLVKDGLLAIPETLEPINNLRERIVLDRRVNPVQVQPDRVEPWLWAVNPDFEAIKYPNGRTRGQIYTYDLGFISPSSISLISVENRNNIAVLHFFSSGGLYSAYSNVSGTNFLNGFSSSDETLESKFLLKSNNYSRYFSGKIRTPVDPLSDLSLPVSDINKVREILDFATASYFNSGFVTYIDDPSQVSLAVEYEDFNVSRDFIPTNSVLPWPTQSEYIFNVYISPTEFEEGQHTSTHFWHFAPSDSNYTLDGVVNVIDRDIIKSTVNESNFKLPVLLDPKNNRSIIYDINNYNLNIFEQQFFTSTTACTKYNIAGSGQSYYKENGNLVTVNSHQPYFLPIDTSNSTGLKSQYLEGDSISLSYPTKKVGIGFLSDSGHYTEDVTDPTFMVKCDPTDTTIPRFELVQVGMTYEYSYVTDLTLWFFTPPVGPPVFLNDFPASGTRSVSTGLTFAVPEGATITFDLIDEGIERVPDAGTISADSDGLTASRDSRHDEYFSSYQVRVNGELVSVFATARDGGIVRRYLFPSSGGGIDPQFGWDVGFTASDFTPVVLSRVLEPLPNWGAADPDDPGNGGFLSTIPDNTARAGELEKFNQFITTPTSSWGYLPTTDGKIQGVKGKITSITFDNTDLGYLPTTYGGSTIDLQVVPLAKMKFLRSFTFEIETVTKKFINTHVLDKEIHYLDSVNINGYLVLGDSFAICKDSMYETPEFGVRSGSILANKALKTPDFSSRYVWRKSRNRKDYLYKYYPLNTYIGDNLTDEKIDYCEQFEFVYDQDNNIYNLEFVDFIEMDFSYKLTPQKDLFLKPENRI